MDLQLPPELLHGLPEIYEDIAVGDKVLRRGKRDWRRRFNLIRPHLRNGLWVDVGSNFGCFARAIARTFPESVVVSFEGDPAVARVQRWLLEQENVRNVVLIQDRVTSALIKRWASCIELFDGFLFLSVLHHLSPVQAHEILSVLAARTPRMFVEFPHPHDDAACGGMTFSQFVPYADRLARYGKLDFLGLSAAHTSRLERSTFLISNDNLHCWGLNYNGCPRDRGHAFTYNGDRGWTISGVNDKPATGLNLSNVLKYNVIYPSREDLAREAEAAYQARLAEGEKITDIRPWNLLFTSSGLRVFDSDEKFLPDPERDLPLLKRSIMGENVKW